MMKYARIRLWIAMGGLVLLAALVLPAPAWAHDPSTGGASADNIRRLFNITLAIAIPVFLLVEGLILFAIIRYRRRHVDEIPEQVEGNHVLEIAWTALAFAIVTVLFILTVRALQTDYTVEAERGENIPDLTVQVEGYLFNWDYTYFLDDDEPTGVKTTKKLTIPADKAVLLEITSRDVQHSFWVPDLGGKVDAIPGYTNTMWLQVSEPGLYPGNCAEYCGLNHYNMLIEVEVVEPAAFDAWLAGQMATANEFVPVGTDLETPLPQGDAARGEQIFSDLACNACHLPEAEQPSGPSIARMMRDAHAHADVTAEEYLHESIVLPCAELAEGYSQCIMPQDYGDRLDAQGLADLIEYLKTY
jgi:cytochrome c oxidase subunit II